MAGSWPYNEVTFKASHNSYERDERPFTRQLAWSGRNPHQAGCRGLELDLRESPNLSVWSIDHDQYNSRADRQLEAYLCELGRWSALNPGHDVITIMLDLKERARDLRQFARYLDVTIDEGLGRDRLFTPGDLMGSHSSLVDAAMTHGWPDVARLAGRFILCLSGDERTKMAYARNSRIRLCFADQRYRSDDRRPGTGTGDRVFFNINATESWGWDDELRWFARQRGFVTRTYGVNSEDLWRRVVRADTNIVATDKVRNHRWAKVGKEPFVRIAKANRPPVPVDPTGRRSSP